MGRSRPHERSGHYRGKPEKPAGRGEQRSEGERPEPAVWRLSLAVDAAVRQPNWYNSHNFYGELQDIEAAKLDEVQAFFKTYYAPEQCRTGGCRAISIRRRRRRWSRNISAGIPAAKLPPPARSDRAAAGQGENRDAERSAGEPPGAGVRLPHAAAQFAGIFRHGAARPDAGAGQRQPALPGTGEETRLHGRCVRRRSTSNSATCSTIPAPCCGRLSLVHDANVKPEQIMSAVDTRDRRVADQAGGAAACWIAASPRCARVCTIPWRSSAASAAPT